MCQDDVLITALSWQILLAHIKATAHLLKAIAIMMCVREIKINVLTTKINRLPRFGGEWKKHATRELSEEEWSNIQSCHTSKVASFEHMNMQAKYFLNSVYIWAHWWKIQ